MSYPDALDALATNKTDSTRSLDGTQAGATAGDHASHHNALATAINSIEAELGTAPSGSYQDVKSAIADLVARVEALEP